MDSRKLLLIKCAVVWMTFSLGKASGFDINHAVKYDDITCNMSSPALRYNKSGVTADIHGVSNQPKPDEEVWIGYVKQYRSFQYIGCVNTSEDGNLSCATWDDCASACVQIGFFGIKPRVDSGFTCTVFLGNVTNTLEANCSSPCGRFTKCQAVDHMYSVFKKITLSENITESDHDNATDCLISSSTSVRIGFTWMQCERNIQSEYPVMCNNISSSDDTRPANMSEQKFGNWEDSMQHCFTEKSYPANVGSIRKAAAQENFTTWTSIIRLKVIVNTKEAETHTMTWHAYVLNGQVLFELSGSNITRRPLCDDKIDNTTTSPETTQEVLPIGQTTVVIDDSEDTDNTGALSGGAIAGIVITVIIVIVAIVITVLFIKYRGLLTNSSSQSHEQKRLRKPPGYNLRKTISGPQALSTTNKRLTTAGPDTRDYIDIECSDIEVHVPEVEADSPSIIVVQQNVDS